MIHGGAVSKDFWFTPSPRAGKVKAIIINLNLQACKNSHMLLSILCFQVLLITLARKYHFKLLNPDEKTMQLAVPQCECGLEMEIWEREDAVA